MLGFAFQTLYEPRSVTLGSFSKPYAASLHLVHTSNVLFLSFVVPLNLSDYWLVFIVSIYVLSPHRSFQFGSRLIIHSRFPLKECDGWTRFNKVDRTRNSQPRPAFPLFEDLGHILIPVSSSHLTDGKITERRLRSVIHIFALDEPFDSSWIGWFCSILHSIMVVYEFEVVNNWDSLRDIFPCLKKVKICGIVTEPYVMKLIEFLLGNAPTWEEMVISLRETPRQHEDKYLFAYKDMELPV